MDRTWARRTLCLGLVFIAAKIGVVSLRSLDGLAAPLWSPWTPIAFFYQDLWVLIIWGVCDFTLHRFGRLAVWFGWSLYGVVAGYVAFNVAAARIFSTPLTYPILTHAGAALADSIRIYFTAQNIVSVLAVAALAAFLPRFVTAPRRRLLVALSVLAAPVLALGPLATAHLESAGLHRNALWAFASTALRQIVGSHTDALELEPLVATGPATDLRSLRAIARGKNVVWVVLESTAAQYLKLYGAERDPTPHLTQLAARGVVFDSLYTVYPESIKGLFATLCSRAPAPYTGPERYTARALPCPSVAEQFATAGYRTALFHSGRFVYLGMQGIVDQRGFEKLIDAGDVGGKYASSFGVDEASTVRKILEYIDALKAGERFFLMYLPIAGHHPYNAPGEGPRPFDGPREIDIYASDLYRGDLALGALIEGLARRGLDPNTLWVVMGDHGEAFQQHPGNLAHTLFLYEENLHVPLVIVPPGQTAQHAAQVGSTIDVAPTLLDLVGLPIPSRYQGRTLLIPEPGIARFFTDQALWLAGLRVGRWKFIHELETGRSQLFDLDQDQGEQHDLSSTQSERVARFRNHLLGWMAYR